MASYRLSYFDFHGGRGEPARLALTMAGIKFEDDRIPFSEWQQRKPEIPYGGLPVLAVDGRIVAQSNTINRYIGRLTNLYPADPWQAAMCDEVMDAVEDIGTKIVATFSLPEDRKRVEREALVAGALPLYLCSLQRRLESQGRLYFADNRLTVADLKVFVWLRHMRSGSLDHIPRNLPDHVAPLLVEHCRQVGNEPSIRSYYARQGLALQQE